MNPLPEKKHFTAKECADAWGISVQDLLQYGAYGKIELMVYLELTEGIMYVFRKGKSPREEIKRSVWGEFQILSPMVCRGLQVHFSLQHQQLPLEVMLGSIIIHQQWEVDGCFVSP